MIQSLVMVYAQLIHTQLNAVVNFLCSVPGPNGETALEFVLSQWVERQFLFFGAYETKVSIIALAKLLQVHQAFFSPISLNSRSSKLKDFHPKIRIFHLNSRNFA